MLLLLVITAASIICVSFVKAYLMLVIIAIIGFSYGGYIGVLPVLSADFWGIKNAAQNYGIVLFGFGVGTVASLYTIAYFSTAKAFSSAFLIAGIAAIIRYVTILMLKPPRLKTGN